MREEVDFKQKGLENLILLVLGAVDRPITLLHLEKEIFLLWNFHPSIRGYLRFIKHYRGPFSKEIQETVQHPVYLENLWRYVPPKPGDRLTGGYIELTEKGKEEYQKLVKKVLKEPTLAHLFAGIKMVRELYDKLTPEELLLLIYDTYEDYTEKSDVYREIERKKRKIAENLKRKGIIDEERYRELIKQ